MPICPFGTTMDDGQRAAAERIALGNAAHPIQGAVDALSVLVVAPTANEDALHHDAVTINRTNGTFAVANMMPAAEIQKSASILLSLRLGEGGASLE